MVFHQQTLWCLCIGRPVITSTPGIINEEVEQKE